MIMNILLIDWKINRASAIKQAIEGRLLNKITITIWPQANGLDKFDKYLDNTIAQCSGKLNEINPDLILLHVGPDQNYAAKCLNHIFTDRIVVCYTGSNIPQEVVDDCSRNQKHCYYPEQTTFNENENLPDRWKNSPEGIAILKFIEQLLEIYPNNTDNPGDINIESFLKIKNALQNLDMNLEEVLDSLALELQTMLSTSLVTADGIRVLAKSRDEKLAAAQIK
ncbi:MAG: hypothetical protein ABL857_03875 [Rickettsiales bacterium]